MICLEFIKKYGGLIIFILGAPFIYCLANNWLYYYFDVLAKTAPAIAGAGAYYMWSQNREKELKKMEFKHKYYGKILDKRIEAYEKFNFLITKICEKGSSYIQVNEEKSDVVFHLKCFTTRESLEEILDLWSDTMRLRIWGSKEIDNTLSNIGRRLSDAVNEVRQYNHDNNEDYFFDQDGGLIYINYSVWIASNYEKDLIEYANEVDSIIQKDLLKLNHIKAFLKSRKS